MLSEGVCRRGVDVAEHQLPHVDQAVVTGEDEKDRGVVALATYIRGQDRSWVASSGGLIKIRNRVKWRFPRGIKGRQAVKERLSKVRWFLVYERLNELWIEVD